MYQISIYRANDDGDPTGEPLYTLLAQNPDQARRDADRIADLLGNVAWEQYVCGEPERDKSREALAQVREIVDMRFGAAIARFELRDELRRVLDA